MQLIEPSKPGCKITAQLYAAVATGAGADKTKAAEIEFLTFLEQLGLKESKGRQSTLAAHGRLLMR